MNRDVHVMVGGEETIEWCPRCGCIGLGIPTKRRPTVSDSSTTSTVGKVGIRRVLGESCQLLDEPTIMDLIKLLHSISNLQAWKLEHMGKGIHETMKSTTVSEFRHGYQSRNL